MNPSHEVMLISIIPTANDDLFKFKTTSFMLLGKHYTVTGGFVCKAKLGEKDLHLQRAKFARLRWERSRSNLGAHW